MNILNEYRNLAEELLEAAHRFYAFRLQMSDGGNLSVRIPGAEYMIVKGSNIDFGSLGMETLVVADFDGKLIEGTARPSKESLLHGSLYREFPDISAIMHCHSPWATAWAGTHDALAFATHHAAIKLGGYCPVFDTGTYVVPEAFFPRIHEAVRLHPDMKGFLLRGHGQLTFASSVREAAMLAELIEETAMISRLSGC